MSDLLSIQALQSNSTKLDINDHARTGAPTGSWFEAMAESWAKALDKQANNMIQQADIMRAGNESPSEISMLTAESLRMQFLSNSSHTALSSMGSALETMARKQ